MSAEQNKEGCVIVRISEREEVIGIVSDAFWNMTEIVGRFHLISKKDPKIRELADSFDSKTDSLWEK